MESYYSGNINADDFAGGKEEYQRYLDQYISYHYEPINEEYEEAKFLIENWDDKLMRCVAFNRKIAHLSFKNKE